MSDYKITFVPSFKEITIQEDKTILAAARDAGVYVDSHCTGKGACGKCKIRIVKGDAGPFATQEARFINEHDRENGYRLACMSHATSDLTVFVPGENIVKSAVAKKLFSKRSKIVNPAVKAYSVNIAGESKRKSSSAHHAYKESAAAFLMGQYGISGPVFDITAVRNIASSTKEGKGKVTAFLWMDREVIDVWPGPQTALYGVALDIGTTTVAVYLCDIATGDIAASGSITNPQVLFGTDIMSRIGYSIDHPETGVKKMQKEVVTAVNAMVEQMASGLEISLRQIVDITVVGNTVMHHIVLGIAPDHLGKWPFSPSVQKSVDVKARDLGFSINPGAYAHVLAVEAGFVGADNVAVLLSEEPQKQDELALIIDLGTNGELVLGNKNGLTSCSCATGPALEGAHISSGMRATAGAIEKVRIDVNTLEADYCVVGTKGWALEHKPGALKPVGICGSGIIDIVAQLYKAGLIDKKGAFTKKKKTTRLRAGHNGIMEYVVAWKEETPMGADIVMGQKDIRQIQLAKAALYGGCKILMSHHKIASVKKIVIAGAFGMHIDKESALTIGLLPSCDPENILMVGNAAGHGAYLALMDRAKRDEANTLAGEVEHLELALEESFQTEFMKALNIP